MVTRGLESAPDEIITAGLDLAKQKLSRPASKGAVSLSGCLHGPTGWVGAKARFAVKFEEQ
jgi:hypothetical protein